MNMVNVAMVSLLSLLSFSSLANSPVANRAPAMDNKTASAVVSSPAKNGIFERMKDSELPKGLADWSDWVRFSARESACPSDNCVWVSQPSLSVRADGAMWQATVRAFSAGKLPLPSFEKSVPTVSVDGKPSPLLSVAEVAIPSGERKVSVEWHWRSMPMSMTVPPSSLPSGRFFFEGKERKVSDGLSKESQIKSGLDMKETDIKIFRHFSDSVPVKLTVLVKGASPNQGNLDISGLLPPGFVWGEVSSDTNAKVFQEGNLRVLTIPGNWQVALTAYGSELPETVLNKTALSSGRLLNGEEVVLFARNVSKRKMSVSGGRQVDVGILDAPPNWKGVDAWALKTGSELKFREDVRGIDESKKTTGRPSTSYFLTTSGNEWFASSAVSVSSSGFSRAGTPWKAESMSRNGVPVRMTDEDTAGVFIPPGTSSLGGIMSVAKDNFIGELPLSPWTGDWDGASGTVFLPTGWRLLGVYGPVNSSTDWISSWTLFDIFAMSILLVLTRKVFGWKAVSVLSIFLLLTWHESAAPKWLFVHAVLIGALLGWNKLDEFAKAKKWFSIYCLGIAFVSLGVVLPFSIEMFRLAMFPSLQYGQTSFVSPAENAALPAAVRPQPAKRDKAALASSVNAVGDVAGAADGAARQMAASPESPVVEEQEQQVLKEVRQSVVSPEGVQIGRAVPSAGKYKGYSFSSLGRVSNGENMKLVLSPPWMSRLGDLFKGLLPFVFVMFAFGPKLAGVNFMSLRKMWIVSCLALLVSFQPNDAMAFFPTNEMLSELESRIVERACQSECVVPRSVNSWVDGGDLKMRIEVDVPSRSEFRLPGGVSGWLPSSVEENGKPLPVSRQNEIMVVALEKGVHTLNVSGRAFSDAMTVPLNSSYPFLGIAVSESKDWKMSFSVDAIVLKRVSADVQELKRDDWKSSLSGAWYMTRFFVPQKDKWQIRTTITAVGSAAPSKTFFVKLLKDELVLSDKVTASDGILSVSVPPSGTMSWVSSIPFGSLELLGEEASLPVIYRVSGSDEVSIGFSGAFPVPESGILSIYPKLREKFVMSSKKLLQSKGDLISTESSVVSFSSSEKFVSMFWETTFNGSIGSDRTVTVPDGYVVKKVSMNGQKMPFKFLDGKVSVSIPPGRHKVSMEAEKDGSWSGWSVFSHPVVEPAAGSFETKIDVSSRWVLWLSSATMSPVMFFWGAFLVLSLVFYGVSRLPSSVLAASSVLPFVIGISTAPSAHWIVAICWFVMMGTYAKTTGRFSASGKKGYAVFAGFLTLMFVSSLFELVRNGLLGSPDMSIIWNGGSWRSDVDPMASMISLPLWMWHSCMLIWAVWMSKVSVSWFKKGWESVSGSFAKEKDEIA